MKLSAFIEGLQVLKQHFVGEDGYHIGAEYDQFYVYQTETALTEAEVAHMRKLGWFQPELGPDAPYNPQEGWSAFL